MTSLYRRLAPVLDTICISVFIVVGKDRHSYDNKGLEWFLTVFWPLAVGWLVGALIMRVYTRDDRWALRQLGTLVIGLFVGGILRGGVHGPRVVLGLHRRRIPVPRADDVRLAPDLAGRGPGAGCRPRPVSR